MLRTAPRPVACFYSNPNKRLYSYSDVAVTAFARIFAPMHLRKFDLRVIQNQSTELTTTIYSDIIIKFSLLKLDE